MKKRWIIVLKASIIPVSLFWIIIFWNEILENNSSGWQETKNNYYISQNIQKNKNNIEKMANYCTKNYIPDKNFVLTFDDWPHKTITKEILQILWKHDITGIFFLLWENVKKNPDVLKKIIKKWHIIWNHTYSHPSLIETNKEKTIKEIASTNEIINKNLWEKYPLRLFRPTYWISNEHTQQILEQKDMVSCLWNLNTKDWKMSAKWTSKKQIMERINSKIDAQKNNWLNILLHDNEKNTPKILDEIIKNLLEKWYSSAF